MEIERNYTVYRDVAKSFGIGNQLTTKSKKNGESIYICHRQN
jgi:hypothetical protein